MAALAGCSATAGTTHAAPAWVVCNTTLSKSAAGAVVTDASAAPGVRVTNETVGGIALLVSRDCAHGAVVTIVPSDAAVVTASALTTDGKVAGALISPRRGQFTITVAHPGGTVTTVDVALGTGLSTRF